MVSVVAEPEQGESEAAMAASQEKGDKFELAALNPQTNGDRTEHPTPDSMAVPKHIAGRKQSSSKKFKIESVSVCDDPLYNSDASSPSRLRKLGKETAIDKLPYPPPEAKTSLPFVDSTRVKPEGSGGEALFQSSDGLSVKPRSASVQSANDQKYYSIENLDKAPSEPDVCNEASESQVVLRNPPTAIIPPDRKDAGASNNTSADRIHSDGITPAANVVRRSRALGNSRLKFDDSFYKRALVETQVDSQDVPDPEAVTDIFVPVPTTAANTAALAATRESTIHETITSAYETNLSINKLLRERHKGSLAAMGRFFGNKQKELEQEKSEATLLSSAVVKPNRKKKRCACLRQIHICLTLTFLLIVSSTIATLVMIESSRESEYLTSGYHVYYKTRELVIYNWTSISSFIPPTATVLFKAHLGVNISPGIPYNCTNASSPDFLPNEVGCYKWYNTSTVRIAADDLGSSSLCLNIEWSTSSYTPVLEDCIELDEKYYGHWYGGHIKRGNMSLNSEKVDGTSYLPGKKFGMMAERMWLSTKGMVVVASHDFPLHLSVKDKRICLSSWYGYGQGSRKLSYSVCRAPNHRDAHKLALDKFYNAYTSKSLNTSILSQPIYSLSGDVQQGRRTVDQSNMTYSYILDNGVAYNLIADYPVNATERTGIQFSPYSSLATDFDISSPVWMQSTDMDVPRLFNVHGKPQVLLNASQANVSTLLSSSLNRLPEGTVVHATDLALGDIQGKEYYALNESRDTFQPYVADMLSLITTYASGPVMSSVVSATQNLSVVTYLQPTDDLGDTIRQVLHSSLMGYDLINAGEISGSLSVNQLIRTLQLAIFLPVIQFSDSVLKHMSNDKVAAAWETCRQLRQELEIAETIAVHIANNQTRHPLYAPVWWHDVESAQFDISDQFIFNDRYLVAPMVNASATLRTVYLPPGFWWIVHREGKDFRVRDGVLAGNQTKEFEVDLNQILIFDKVRKSL